MDDPYWYGTPRTDCVRRGHRESWHRDNLTYPANRNPERARSVFYRVNERPSSFVREGYRLHLFIHPQYRGSTSWGQTTWVAPASCLCGVEPTEGTKHSPFQKKVQIHMQMHGVVPRLLLCQKDGRARLRHRRRSRKPSPEPPENSAHCGQVPGAKTGRLTSFRFIANCSS